MEFHIELLGKLDADDIRRNVIKFLQEHLNYYEGNFHTIFHLSLSSFWTNRTAWFVGLIS